MDPYTNGIDQLITIFRLSFRSGENRMSICPSRRIIDDFLTTYLSPYLVGCMRNCRRVRPDHCIIHIDLAVEYGWRLGVPIVSRLLNSLAAFLCYTCILLLELSLPALRLELCFVTQHWENCYGKLNHGPDNRPLLKAFEA